MDPLQKLNQLRADHDTDRPGTLAALAELALTLDEELGAYAQLVNHVVGDEERDRPLAVTLLSRLLARKPEDETGLVGAHLAVALFLNGDSTEALEAELAARHPGVPIIGWIRLRCAESLVQAKEMEAGAVLVTATFDGPLLAGTAHASNFDRPIAVACNNLATGLFEAPMISRIGAEAIERTALLSRTCWIRCGSWVQHERADYLLALAYNALRRHDLAEDAARHGLDLIAAHEGEAVDRAFLTVELALALDRLGRAEEAAAARQEALQLAEPFRENAFLAPWFDGQFARIDGELPVLVSPEA
ncbi:MAG TPA: hypothetical protein VM689_23210 [Aliidongia sp.]|nr:hypothetical protein [Aliidongia sp.]